MSEASPERAPLSPEERAEQIRLAKERAAAARAARTSGEPAAAQSVPPPAEPNPAAAAVPSAAEPARAAPPSPADRAAAIEAAKARAAAARAAREGGAPPPPAAAEAPAAATAAAPAGEPARAEPLSPADRAAAIEAAKARAAAARVARESGAPPPAPAAAAAPRAAMSVEDRAAAVAQAQQRAAAIRAQRAAVGAPAAAATADATPTWRVAPNGASGVMTARPEARAQALAQTDAQGRIVLRRRQVLRGGFWAGFGVLAAGALATFADFFNPRHIVGFGGTVTVPAANVPSPGADPFHYLEGKTWISNLKEGEGVIAGIGQPGPAGVIALYHKCPHLGCTVPWNPAWNYLDHLGWFKCPCHGSTYSKCGYRVFGPAPHSMWSFPVTVDKAGNLQVNTGKITNGNLTQATTAVPYSHT